MNINISAVALFKELQQIPQSLTQIRTNIKVSFNMIPAFAGITKLN